MTDEMLLPPTQRIFRLGRKPKRVDPRTLQFKKYATIAPTGLTVPPSADFSTLVNPWPMYGNDSFGDCTFASIAHGTQLLSAMAGEGNAVTPTGFAVLQGYFDIDNNGTPFAAGAPQDEGCDILTVIQWWKQKGLSGVNPFAFVEVDTANLDEVKVAISLFGGLDTGVNLPLAAQGQSEWTTVYDQGNANTWPGTWGGHSIWVVKFDATGVWVVSWGTLYFVSWEFWTAYFDEAYAVLPNDWQLRPDGFDFTQLEADLTALQNVS